MTAPTGSRPWPEHWAIFVAAETDRIENQARVARPQQHLDARAAAAARALEHHLAAARAACSRPGQRRSRRGAADRWRGASVEQAFRHLHAARGFLVDLLPQAEADAMIPDVLARVAGVLDRGDPRRAAAEAALRSRRPAVRRAALKQAMATSYEASDDEYSRLRDFRNIIVLTTIGLTLFIGVLIAVVNHTPKAIPLCFEPGVTTTTATSQQEEATKVCPSGDRHRPTGGDVLIIAGLGAVGGGLGALLAIRNLRGTSTPYGIPTALAVLKVPAGALTAVIGILLLAGGFVPGLSNLDSQRQILAYGLLFGYAQQLITRLVDSQGQQLLERVPSKDSQAEQPTVAMPPVEVETVPEAAGTPVRDLPAQTETGAAGDGGPAPDTGVEGTGGPDGTGEPAGTEGDLSGRDGGWVPAGPDQPAGTGFDGGDAAGDPDATAGTWQDTGTADPDGGGDTGATGPDGGEDSGPADREPAR